MRLVIDANIALSALVAGKLTELVLCDHLDLIAPDLLFVELRNNKEAIRAKSRLSTAEFDLLLLVLEKRIRPVPVREFAAAERLLGDHKKDIPYVALALQTGCPFWTYEKRFTGIRVVTTAEVRSAVKRFL